MDSYALQIPAAGVQERCERLAALQYEQGQDIFASRYSSIHMVAQTGELRYEIWDVQLLSCKTSDDDKIVSFTAPDSVYSMMASDASVLQLFNVLYQTNPVYHLLRPCCEARGLRTFLEANGGCDPDVQNDKGDTALNTAAFSGHLHIAEELLKHKADCNKPNNKGWSPAHTAASQNHPQFLQLLHDRGADLAVCDRAGATPAHLAAATDGVACLQVLHSAQQTSVAGQQQHSHYRHGSLWLDAKTRAGLTPAHLAAQRGACNALRCLHTLGADLQAIDSALETPAHKAARANQVEALETLQLLGVNMHCLNCDGKTPRDLCNDDTT